MFEIKIYDGKAAIEWNEFIDKSRNGTFLFNRNYMDYHADRVQDFSLMAYKKNKLYAVLPANRVGDVLYSHQGLSYGGFITSSKLALSDITIIFEKVNDLLKQVGISKVVYKPVPVIYHLLPAQEDLYVLFRYMNAKLIGRNISSTIYQGNKIKFIESRKSGIRKAIANRVEICESENFESFWEILYDNLKMKYGVSPVHSLKEIKLLASRFPDNIKLFTAQKDGIVLGGTVVYITPQVLHTQYISASLSGKESGALDLLFDHLINHKFTNIPIFDFGQSTEQMGKVLNDALIFQKEGFGGRGVMYDIYEYEVI